MGSLAKVVRLLSDLVLLLSNTIIHIVTMKVFILSALCLASALAEPEAEALNAYTYVNYGGKMMPVTRYNGFRPHEFRTNTYTGYAVVAPYPGYPFATPSSFYNNRVSYNTVSGF